MTTPDQIAKLLLEIKAVTLNVQTPFRYTSGILSPIYCDNRLIISYPDKRKIIIDAFIEMINNNKLQFDVVAGTATAGIPHAAWIAERLNKPMVYVRNKSKEHGKQNQIEGLLKPGQKALIIEDLVSTGGSSVAAGVACREAGAVVTDCVAIFTYQMEKARQAFSQAQINLHTLTNFATLIQVATDEGYISQDEKERALEWNKDPAGWGERIKA